MDLESRCWEAYTQAKEAMLDRSYIPESPWWAVLADDKQRALELYPPPFLPDAVSPGIAFAGAVA